MASIIHVSTQDDLYEALYTSEAGDTILLNGGDYGVLKLLFGPDGLPAIATGLVLMSATPAAPAVFSGLELQGVNDLTLERVSFDAGTAAGDFHLLDSTGIVIRDPVAVGPTALDLIDALPGVAVEQSAPVTAPVTAPAQFAEARTELSMETASDAEAADTILVSNRDEFYSALDNAKGGDTILLKGGNYGYLTLKTAFASDVTIASINPEDPGIFTGLGTNDSKNIVLDGLFFDYTFKDGDVWYVRPFEVNLAENITIRNSVFDGDMASGIDANQDGFGYGFGLSVRKSSGITLENNEFYDFRAAMILSDGTDYTVINNDIHDIRADGMNVAAVQGIRIEDNHFHDFPSPEGNEDHRDMIQFWTNGTTVPTTDVIIRGNLLDIGNGTQTQSIFMRNEMVDTRQAGDEMLYRNILIEENVILNNHLHGITVGETDGLTIRNNTLLRDEGGGEEFLTGALGTPRINVATASRNVVISDNAASDIIGYSGQSNWSISGNVFVQNQDPLAPNHYSTLFVSSSLEMQDGVREVIVLPGSILDQQSVGAAITHASPAEGLLVLAHITGDQYDPAAVVFDATYSQLNGEDLPSGSYFEWDFGDGTSARGQKVIHSYSGGDTYTAVLNVVAPNGLQSSTSISSSVSGSEMLSFDGNQFVAYENGTEIALPGVDAIGSGALKLGAIGTTLSVTRDHVEDILVTDEFTIDFGLSVTSNTSFGEIFRIHGSLEVGVTDHGELSVLIIHEGGARTRVVTSDAGLNDLAEHDISIRYLRGEMQVLVDDALAVKTDLSAPILRGSYHGLTFGSPWASNLDGKLTYFDVSKDASDFPDTPQTTVLIASPEPTDPGPVDPPSEPIPAPETAPPPPPPPTTDGADIEEKTLLETLPLGSTGIIARIAHEEVENLAGAETFEMAFSLQAASTSSKGPLFRLNDSFAASVDDRGELVFRALLDTGEEVWLVTRGAGLNDTAPHQLAIRMAENRLEVWVDDELAGVEALTAPISGDGDRWLVFGNTWDGANFEGELGAFTLADGVTGPMAYHSLDRMDDPFGAGDILVFDPEVGFVAADDGIPVVLPAQDAADVTGLHLAGGGTDAFISDAHVAALRGADEFRIDFGLQSDTDSTRGDLMKLDGGFRTYLNKRGELVFEAVQDSGRSIYMGTKGLDLTDTEAHDISLRHTDGQMEIWVDGALSASRTIADAIGSNGQYGLSFGTAWGNRNFEGTMTSLEMSLDVDEDDGISWIPPNDLIPGV